MSNLIQIPYSAYLYSRPVLLHLFLTDAKGEPLMFLSDDRKRVSADQIEGIKCLWNDYKVKFTNLINYLVVSDVFLINKVEYKREKITLSGRFPIRGRVLDCISCTESDLQADISLRMVDLERLVSAVKNA